MSQRQHALQAACLAERSGARAQLIVAALLHDVGHLLHDLPSDAPDRGVDDRHEELAARWLGNYFEDDVVEPVRLHVAAKRYLCAVDDGYLQQLSEPSVVSLNLQGGPMSADEMRAFESLPMFDSAIALRRWDDEAKVPDFETPSFEHFAQYVDAAAQCFDQRSRSCP